MKILAWATLPVLTVMSSLGKYQDESSHSRLAHQGHREFDEPAPSVQLQSLPQDKQGLLRHLQKTNPEALALAGDWDGTARQLIRVQEQIEL